MTASRRNGGGTAFGLWLRKQTEIDSDKGYIATDIDYIWKNYETNEWMIIEEKTYRKEISKCQRGLLQTFHNIARKDPYYRGVHLLVFEHESPDDGKIWLDKEEISRSELVYFLQHFTKAKFFSYSV